MKLHNDNAYSLEVNINPVKQMKMNESLYEFVLESKFNNDQMRIDKHYLNKETLLQLADYIKNSI
jgi:hypothetical protein